MPVSNDEQPVNEVPKLADGTEITIDLNKITMVEFRAMLKPEQSEDDEYATLEKVSGLKVRELGLQDYRRVIKAFWEKYKEPVDPT